MKFIVDTGASISMLPTSAVNGITLNPTSLSLSTANGEKIKCYGQASLEIGIPSLRRSFTWTIVIVDITNPLLGLDFLNKFGLIVDCSNKTIYDPTTTQRTSLKIFASLVNLVVNEMELPSFVRNMINEKYPDLITPHKNSNKKYCSVYHRIDTGSHKPLFAKPRGLKVEKLEATRSEFKTLQKDGVISLSKSKGSSPLHIVSKQNGGFTCCGDYRSLNSITKTDRYPLANINSFSEKLANNRRFSKIDLISAYHQIKMHPDDVAKTSLTTP